MPGPESDHHDSSDISSGSSESSPTDHSGPQPERLKRSNSSDKSDVPLCNDGPVDAEVDELYDSRKKCKKDTAPAYQGPTTVYVVLETRDTNDVVLGESEEPHQIIGAYTTAGLANQAAHVYAHKVFEEAKKYDSEAIYVPSYPGRTLVEDEVEYTVVERNDNWARIEVKEVEVNNQLPHPDVLPNPLGFDRFEGHELPLIVDEDEAESSDGS